MTSGALFSLWLGSLLQLGSVTVTSSEEARVSAGLVELPLRQFGLNGNCLMGRLEVPSSLYGQTVSGRGQGVGMGVGVRGGVTIKGGVSMHEVSAWWGVRAMAGLDVFALVLMEPVPFAATRGVLCEEVAKRTHVLAYQTEGAVIGWVSFRLGPVVGLGQANAEGWRGLVFGIAWAPSLAAGPVPSREPLAAWTPFGVELSVDPSRRTPREAHAAPTMRWSLTLLAPTDSSQVGSVSLGVGAAWD